MNDKHVNQSKNLTPGATFSVSDNRSHQVKIEVIDYNSNEYKELVISDFGRLNSFNNDETVSWVSIDGVHNQDIITEVGAQFNLHSLLLEDLVNTSHRPKAEDFEDHLFFTFKSLNFDENTLLLGSEQVSIVMSQSYVLSFQETSRDIFDPIRTSIKSNKGVIRQRKSDFLVYALIDSVVDSYFYILEAYDRELGEIEDRIQINPSEEDVSLIQRLKKQLLYLRRTMTTLQEAIMFIQNADSTFLDVRTNKYYQNVQDHLLHIIDAIEMNRIQLDSLIEQIMFSISNRMNQVMKVLTIIATIFIPLTFITGIYGMNFVHMPELAWKWGYPAVLGVMGLIFIGMLAYFQKRKWF